MKQQKKKEKNGYIGNQNALKKIDWNAVDGLLKMGCTGEEIACFLDIDYDTLANHCVKEKGTLFSEYIKSGNSGFKVSLRRLQTRSARGFIEEIKDNDGKVIDRRYIPPSVTMQIWLGKQFLNQKERAEFDQNINFPELPDIIIK